MKTIGSSKPSAPGASGVVIFVCVGAAILAALSTGAYLLSERSSTPTSASLQTGMPTPNKRPSSAVSNASHAEHIDRAMRAYSADKLIAPAGENALEHYLAALQSKPDDFGAQEAILELVPVAMTALETAMASNMSDEVERLIALLERADPSASRVAALKKRWQENTAQQASAAAARLAAEQALQSAQALPAVAASAPVNMPADNAINQGQTARVAEVPVPAAPNKVEALAVNSAASENKPAQRARRQAGSTVAPAAQSLVVEARVLSTARAVFPAQARRQKIEGWVDLQVAVDADGRVTEASVVSAQPSRIFDIEARRAVMRWRYSPKRVNDQPVSSVQRQRIKFSLAG